MDICGLSVTIPHKESVIKMINALDDNVAGIRAANTLVFKHPNIYGFNTDCSAAVESISKTIDGLEELTLEGARVLILGAGGVARAIAFGLKRAKAKVTICARDFRKADDLATALDCESIDWPTRGNFQCHVLVNCTPVGMYPEMDVTPFEEEWLDKECIVFDTVYNPEQTLLIKHARKAGCTTITGIDMFVRQAAKQFKLFTGKAPDVKLIRYEVKRAISAAKY